MASYQLDGSLHIPCVSVPSTDTGNTRMYKADLKTDPTSKNLSFELLNAEEK